MSRPTFSVLFVALVLLAGLAGGALGGEDDRPSSSDRVSGNVVFEPTIIQGSGRDIAVLTGAEVLNGDWDGNGRRDITDVLLCARYLFKSGEPPTNVMCLPTIEGETPTVLPESMPTVRNGDVDGSGRINITDLVRLSRYLFAGDFEEPVAIECDPSGV